MAVKKFIAQAIILHYICDKCGKAPMGFTGKTMAQAPPKQPLLQHQCQGCGELKFLDEQYPQQGMEIPQKKPKPKPGKHLQ